MDFYLISVAISIVVLVAALLYVWVLARMSGERALGVRRGRRGDGNRHSGL